jgi:uncharacterized membrane protein YedE/YeeE
MDATPLALVPLAGLAIGLAFGAVIERTGFCTMGAVSDWAGLGETTRLKAWGLAIAVAIAGTQALHLAGLVDLSTSLYAGTRLGWLGHLAGGAMFGIGMTLAGGCGSRTLARLGAGNLKSLVVVLVLGIAAYATMRGVIAPLRLHLIDPVALPLGRPQSLPELIAPGGTVPRMALAVAIALALALWALRDGRLRARPRLVLGGAATGILVTAGWCATGVMGRDDFTPLPLASLTFVAPIGETLMYAMLSTGTRVTFAVATCIGVVAGAALAALAAGSFRWEGFSDRHDLARHLLGAVLMGVGGVLALGCTIGQGITGLSTLSLGALLTIAGIVGGGALTTRYLVEGSWREAWRSLFARSDPQG